ncbi:MAG TPA: hypothetical protein VHA52_00605 [Candidatus Babeliaceae bacterium]|nr:hypothetical protein [Candidatus Babeliaceae bacterium]
MKKILLIIILLGSGLANAAGEMSFTRVGKVKSGPAEGQTFFIFNDNPTTGIVGQEVEVKIGGKGNAYPYTSADGYVGSLPMQSHPLTSNVRVAQRVGQGDTYYLYSTEESNQ